MKIYTDFHIHSYYSIATSKLLTVEMLEIYAIIKGLKVVSTGDILNSFYLEELIEKLEPIGSGLYVLKKDYSFLYKNNLKKFLNKKKINFDKLLNLNIIINYLKQIINSNHLKNFNFYFPVYFILTGEISSIYKKNGEIRKNHNLIFAPDFNTVKKVQKEIEKRGGNLKSDGRPIVGIDSKILLEITYKINNKNLFVPAHIWTPWFSMLGSKSGFDSIYEAFDEYSEKIYAIETGLSSDPQMNFLCSFLDNITLLSNSDAHSPEKLGRNANIFEVEKEEISYNDLVEPIKNKKHNNFIGTIDTFPQLGKYYYDGHRKCNFKINPIEAQKKFNNICPICNKKITKGVLSRVLDLADRKYSDQIEHKHKFNHIVTLKEIISKTLKKGENSKIVDDIYCIFIILFGNELNQLLEYDYTRILHGENIENYYIFLKDYFLKNNYSGSDNLKERKLHLIYKKNIEKIKEIIENIIKIRNKRIKLNEGFDGQFGNVIF